jgi:hypothetical protein
VHGGAVAEPKKELIVDDVTPKERLKAQEVLAELDQLHRGLGRTLAWFGASVVLGNIALALILIAAH